MNRKAPINYDFKCPMCGDVITGIKKAGSWTDKKNGNGFGLVAICGKCDIDFRMSVRSGKPGSWRMVAPDRTELAEIVTADEMESLNNKLLRYKILGQKWRKFLSKRREADEIWRYNRGDGGTAIAIVRDGTPIAEFRAFADL